MKSHPFLWDHPSLILVPLLGESLEVKKLELLVILTSGRSKRRENSKFHFEDRPQNASAASGSVALVAVGELQSRTPASPQLGGDRRSDRAVTLSHCHIVTLSLSHCHIVIVTKLLGTGVDTGLSQDPLDDGSSLL